MTAAYVEQILLLVESAADGLVDVIRAAQAQNDTKLAEDAMFLYGKVLALRPGQCSSVETQ